MTRYSINPAGVAAVLSRTTADSDVLAQTYQAMTHSLDDASAAAGGSEIPGALAEAVAYLQNSGRVSEDLVSQCVEAADDAVGSYVGADAQMAQQFAGGN